MGGKRRFSLQQERAEEDDEESLQAKYFGKDPRFFHGRKDPHTLRKVAKYRRKFRSVVRERVTEEGCFYPQGISEFPLTAVDELFDDGFALYNNDWRGNMRPLEKDDEYEIVQEVLDECAVRKVREYVKSDRAFVYHYEVPVSNFCTRSFAPLPFQNFIGDDVRRRIRGRAEANTGMDLRLWPFVNGKFWDPGYLYLATFEREEYHPMVNCLVKPQSLKPLLPRIGTPKYKEMFRLGDIAEGLHRLAIRSYADCPNKQLKHNQTMVNGYLEVDLQVECSISHIGLMGGYPHFTQTSMYPSPYDDGEDDTYNYISGTYRRRRNSSSAHISIVTGRHLSYVMNYNLQYRHPITRQWIPYGEVFNGNVNSHEEVLNKVSIRARYIRFVPLEFHNKLQYTLFVYGQEILQQNSATGMSGHGAKRRNNSKGGNNSVFRKNEVQTVKYSLYPVQISNFRHDGCGHHGCKDRYGDDSMWRKRDTTRKIINEDKAAFEDY